MSIWLNSDLGESFGAWKMGMDEKIMPLIDMANIACGFHASDPLVMQKTVAIAKPNNVRIGAHPGYPDLVGFGRRSLKCTPEEIEAFIIYQCGALEAVCQAQKTHVSYVKPHGALYNDMMKDDVIFTAILKAMSKLNTDWQLMILSTNDNERYAGMAAVYGIELLYEVFADRGYTDEGLLVPRTEEGAVIHEVDAVIQRMRLLEDEGKLVTVSGKKIKMRADSMCVHGDNEEALALVKSLREFIKA